MHPMLVTTAELDAMLDRDDVVVVDSNPFDNWGDEGRMYWMLKYLGHPNVRVLDGGWIRWSAEMRRFECGPAKPRPAVFKANVDPSLITNKAEVRRLVEGLHPDTILADARSTEEYNGAFQQGIARGGHIPSAVNVPWNQFCNPDGTVKPVDAIHAILEKQGVAPGKEVVCYCTGGVRSAWLYFILKLAGYEKVRNYPGSWWEWGNDYTLPVVNLKEQQRPPIQRTMPNKPPTVQ